MKRTSRKTFHYSIILALLPICLGIYIYHTHANAANETQFTGLEKEALDEYSIPHLEIPAPLENRSELILHRKTYTVSYNDVLKLPNWVAWELNTKKLVERESRTNKFLPDPDLPAYKAVTTKDYSGSGYDRGHMCPAADNRWHWKAMQESFYMTNICPQHHNLNRGDWKELEDACREWAIEEGRIYIVCGPIIYKNNRKTIGTVHKITVPDAFFKVVLCTTGKAPKAIGFIYKNNAGNKPLDSYTNSIDEVERITGIDFFPNLPDHIEKEVEATYNLKLWRQHPLTKQPKQPKPNKKSESLSKETLKKEIVKQINKIQILKDLLQ